MKKTLLQLGLLVGMAGSVFAAGPAIAGTRVAYDATLSNGFTIHHVRHEAMGESTRLYIDDKDFVDVPTAQIQNMTEVQEPIPQTASAQTAPATAKLASEADVKQAITDASGKHQIDPDFISSVIHAESSFNSRAVSPKGAQGLMQLMPGTATQLGVKNAFDPAANVDGGTRYLRELLLRYNGDMAKTLAAYNAGPQRVEQYHGVPPFPETRAYVIRIIKEFNKKKTQTASKKPARSSGETALASNVKGR